MAMRPAPALMGDRGGTVAVITAITLAALLGMAGLAVDAGRVYMQRAMLQQAGDNAAIAGALAYRSSSSAAMVTATVREIVEANGWAASIIQSPTAEYLASSPQNPANAAVLVHLVAQVQTTLIGLVHGAGAVRISTVSVVELAGGVAPVCMLSLSTLMVNGKINTSGCGIAANSGARPAVTVNGGGSIIASTVSTPGSVTDNGSIKAIVKSGAPRVADPFQSYQAQANSYPTSRCMNYGGQSTLAAGCWSNVNVNSGSTLTLQSGTFYFRNLNVNSGASLVATAAGGTTIIASQQFSPSGTITVTAPTTGAWQGMAIYAMGGMNINSGVRYTINGAIYSPGGSLIPDSGTWNQSACTEIVANGITFNSSATFTLPQNNCAFYGFPTADAGGGSATVALRQ